MAATIQTTTSSTFLATAAAHAAPRSMLRSDVPLREAEKVSESEMDYEVRDGTIRLIADRSSQGSSAKAGLQQKVLQNCTEDSENGGDGDSDGAGASHDDTRDVVTWIPSGGEDAFVEITEIPGERLWIILCDDSLTETSIMDVLASLVRAVVLPFREHGCRADWKRARRPRVVIDSDWAPQDGAFDVPVGRRLSTITESTNRRLDVMYDKTFSRKITSLARAAVSRWAKKCNLVVRSSVLKAIPGEDAVEQT